jgi:asparagine synthase (glutamine-hydrolysing)
MAGREDHALCREMTRRIAHRGPDGAGMRGFPAADGRVPAILGHRRLAILDPTERGAQPMADQSGRYWITYNGEIYNFRELRKELARDGFGFSSECDTEVLLALYARDGEDMLPRLNGIFAFAIWDAERGELFLARDRLGVKPLYFAEAAGVLYFASEAKALLAALPAVRLNLSALAQYLTFLWVPDPETLFDGIAKLPPGHSARWRDGSLRIRQWWDWAFEVDERPEDDWINMVRASVSDSVRRQMVSDVPLGSFLSGGVDSGAIVAEMTGAVGRVSTYTVGLSKEDLRHDIVTDDVRYARKMAAAYPIDYHERTLDSDVVDLLPRLVWHMDEPIADPAAITTYLICATARERLTVVLSGMGGDEVFAGYPRHLAARLARAADVLPQGVRRRIRRTAQRRVTVGGPGVLRAVRRNLLKFVGGLDEPWQERYLTHASYYRSEELSPLLSDEVRAAGMVDPFRRHREYLERVAGEHWLNQILYLDLKTFLPCLNLAYTDKMSMAASTEVRVPLLDNQIVDLCGRIPPGLKLRRTTRKYVFKRSQEGNLPPEIIWRRKAGFTAPVRSWLVGDLREMVSDLLSPDTVAGRGLFDSKRTSALIRDNAAGKGDYALRIWALLTLELWQREFLDGRGSAPTTATVVSGR